jgi:hypothetical protein
MRDAVHSSHPFASAAGLAFVVAVAATPVLSQTHTENIVSESRTSVSLRVKQEGLQAFMPAGWVPGGPNLTLIFMDRPVQRTPDGKPLGSGVNRTLVLSATGRNSATGETKGLIVGEFSSDPAGVPGAYKTYREGQIGLARIEIGQVKNGALETLVSETWSARGADGSTVDLALTFTRGAPAPVAFEQKVYSGADPNFYRIYKGTQASEVLRNATVNKVQSVTLKASGGRLGRVIDGTEEIVSISSAPYYTRQTYVP